MKKLLSLPPNLVSCFHDITGLKREEWYCTNDPIGQKLGSGGGTAWLLEECYKADANSSEKNGVSAEANPAPSAPSFTSWLK